MMRRNQPLQLPDPIRTATIGQIQIRKHPVKAFLLKRDNRTCCISRGIYRAPDVLQCALQIMAVEFKVFHQ
jgi:hypothetical protein